MTDTFPIKYGGLRQDSDSLLEVNRPRDAQWPGTSSQASRRSRRQIQFEELTPHHFLEIVVFFDALALWTTGIVMLLFAVYIISSQYGLAVLSDSVYYIISMVLQTASAVFILIAAGLTTSCYNVDLLVHRRAIWGLVFLILALITLTSEIVVTHHNFKELQTIEKELNISLKKYYKNPFARDAWNDMQSKYSCCGVTSMRDWTNIPNSCCKKYEGGTCVEWNDDGCLKIHRRLERIHSELLIGSASVSLANVVISIPVLVQVFRIGKKDASRVGPSYRLSRLPTAMSSMGSFVFTKKKKRVKITVPIRQHGKQTEPPDDIAGSTSYAGAKNVAGI